MCFGLFMDQESNHFSLRGKIGELKNIGIIFAQGIKSGQVHTLKDFQNIAFAQFIC